jgi:cation diffusion facilitator CzcD-associated flavoprotein CzcO
VITQQFDAIIIGAGISGISAAYHFQKNCPGKTYKILERRESLGGTWDLFNYPGIRSDSDMYTFGFSFKPWKDRSSIAPKHKILSYLDETTREFGIDQHIEFERHIKSADWSSKHARWTIEASDVQSGEAITYNAQYVFMAVGYYNYDQAHAPKFEGIENFSGEVVHPQFWPVETNYTDKNVVIIGSGATAITLLPAMADKAKHVTMLQRSPTYMGSKPAEDAVAIFLSKWIGHWAARWWAILQSMFIYSFCQLFPKAAKKSMISEIEEMLGDKFDAKHFTPNYAPWDQRVCLCPDADFFEAIKADKAHVETDQIANFTENGINLKSGKQLEADLVVTATGLEMLFLGGIEVTIDGVSRDPGSLYIYKGFMCSGTPNMFACLGYTNASWTLKVDLSNQYACRLINHIDRNGHDYCMPEAGDHLVDAPLLNLSSTYIQRSVDSFPKQATKVPWKLYQNFIYDNLSLRFTPVTDDSIKFKKAG